MDFLPCLKDSISDFDSRAEANEVTRFVTREGLGLDAKDLNDFISEPRRNQSNCSLIGL